MELYLNGMETPKELLEWKDKMGSFREIVGWHLLFAPKWTKFQCAFGREGIMQLFHFCILDLNKTSPKTYKTLDLLQRLQNKTTNIFPIDS